MTADFARDLGLTLIVLGIVWMVWELVACWLKARR